MLVVSNADLRGSRYVLVDFVPRNVLTLAFEYLRMRDNAVSSAPI